MKTMTSDQYCPECGYGVLKWAVKDGRVIKYEKGQLVIPATMELLTCNRCDEDWIDFGNSKDLDEMAREQGIL